MVDRILDGLGELLLGGCRLLQLLLHQPGLVLLDLAPLDIFVGFLRGGRWQNRYGLVVLVVDLDLFEGFAVDVVLLIERFGALIGVVLITLRVVRVFVLLICRLLYFVVVDLYLLYLLLWVLLLVFTHNLNNR